ncbi:MAG: hypothetical protein GX613_06035 [Chloroflexi bacterium]|nr:hypothetical protein [Chloroflexota bacterium]
MTEKLPSLPDTSFRTRAMLVGGVVGLVVGLLAAHLYTRAAEENMRVEPGKIGTMDAVRIGIALMAIVRQITDMASHGDKA